VEELTGLAQVWLRRMDRNMKTIGPILADVYGDKEVSCIAIVALQPSPCCPTELTHSMRKKDIDSFFNFISLVHPRGVSDPPHTHFANRCDFWSRPNLYCGSGADPSSPRLRASHDVVRTGRRSRAGRHAGAASSSRARNFSATTAATSGASPSPPPPRRYKSDAHLSPAPYKSDAHLSPAPYKAGAHLPSNPRSHAALTRPRTITTGGRGGGGRRFVTHYLFEKP